MTTTIPNIEKTGMRREREKKKKKKKKTGRQNREPAVEEPEAGRAGALSAAYWKAG